MTSTTGPRAVQRAWQFHALADETRLHILAVLRGRELCVCELTEALNLGQSLLSFHLKTLKEAGLVTDRREGRWIYYALEEAALREMATELTKLAAGHSRNTRALGRCE